MARYESSWPLVFVGAQKHGDHAADAHMQARASALARIRSSRLRASEASFRGRTRPLTPKLLPAERVATDLPQRLAAGGQFAAAREAQAAADAAQAAATGRLQRQRRTDFLAEVRTYISVSWRAVCYYCCGARSVEAAVCGGVATVRCLHDEEIVVVKTRHLDVEMQVAKGQTHTAALLTKLAHGEHASATQLRARRCQSAAAATHRHAAREARLAHCQVISASHRVAAGSPHRRVHMPSTTDATRPLTAQRESQTRPVTAIKQPLVGEPAGVQGGMTAEFEGQGGTVPQVLPRPASFRDAVPQRSRTRDLVAARQADLAPSHASYIMPRRRHSAHARRDGGVTNAQLLSMRHGDGNVLQRTM